MIIGTKVQKYIDKKDLKTKTMTYKFDNKKLI